MSIADWCQAIQASQIGTSIRESALVFPLIETAHVIGLSLSVGIILLLDLRLVGAASAATIAKPTAGTAKSLEAAKVRTGSCTFRVDGKLAHWASSFTGGGESWPGRTNR